MKAPKRLFACALVCGIAGGLFAMPPVSEAAGTTTPPAYAFFCRGGANMTAEMFTVDHNNSPMELWVRFGYKRGTRGVKEGLVYKVDRLDPGTCAWGDRGVNADEPKMLSMPVSDQVAKMVTYGSMVECMRDEHCVFNVYAYRDGSTMAAKASNRVDFWRVP